MISFMPIDMFRRPGQLDFGLLGDEDGKDDDDIGTTPQPQQQPKPQQQGQEHEGNR